MTDLLEKRLLKIKGEIEEAKERRSRAKGKLEAALERLRGEFSCQNEEEAQTKIDRLEDELQANRKKLQLLVEKLEKDLRSFT